MPLMLNYPPLLDAFFPSLSCPTALFSPLGTLSSQSPHICQHPHILGMFQGGHIIQVEDNDDGWKSVRNSPRLVRRRDWLISTALG